MAQSAYTRDEIKAIVHAWTCYVDECENNHENVMSFDDWFDENY